LSPSTTSSRAARSPLVRTIRVKKGMPSGNIGGDGLTVFPPAAAIGLQLSSPSDRGMAIFS
jgi:hypothetical protein